MARFGSAKFGVDTFGSWARAKSYGNYRILPMLAHFLFGRKRPFHYHTIAGLVKGNKWGKATVAGHVNPYWIPYFSTVAGIVTMSNTLWDVMAGIIECKAKRLTTVAGIVVPCVRATVAGILTAQYSWWSRVAGIVIAIPVDSVTSGKASTIGSIVIPCVRAAVAGIIEGAAIKGHTIAGIISGDKIYTASVAGIVNVQEPPYDIRMQT